MTTMTRENMDTRVVSCDDEGNAPDAPRIDDRAPRVTVILIDHGDVVVDALDWF